MPRLAKDERDRAVAAIQEHFRAERGETLGELAASLVLDFIETELGPAFYNQGVRDAKAVALRTLGTLDEELDALCMVPKRARR